LKTLLTLIDGCLFIDNSSLQQFMTCPRAASYNLVAKRQLNKTRPALIFGGALHKALEVRYRKGGAIVTSQTQEEQIVALAKAFRGVDIPPDDHRQLDYAVETIGKYNNTYKVDNFKPIDIPNFGLGIEVPFALPLFTVELAEPARFLNVTKDGIVEVELSSIPVVYTGRIDMFATRGSETIIVDHKSSSIGGAEFFDEFYISAQFKGYRWAAQQLSGRRVDGVVINALIVRKPTKAGWSGEFLRNTIYYDDSHIEEWKESTMHVISDFLHNYSRQYYPMHTMWCKGKYGRCEYFDICQLPPSSREVLIDSGLYKDITWSPLHEEEDTKPQLPHIPQVYLP
jgi:hypothetical protein